MLANRGAQDPEKRETTAKSQVVTQTHFLHLERLNCKRGHVAPFSGDNFDMVHWGPDAFVGYWVALLRQHMTKGIRGILVLDRESRCLILVPCEWTESSFLPK
jgi:hypothetical protein